jgi:hypothetical protein
LRHADLVQFTCGIRAHSSCDDGAPFQIASGCIVPWASRCIAEVWGIEHEPVPVSTASAASVSELGSHGHESRRTRRDGFSPSQIRRRVRVRLAPRIHHGPARVDPRRAALASAKSYTCTWARYHSMMSTRSRLTPISMVSVACHMSGVCAESRGPSGRAAGTGVLRLGLLPLTRNRMNRLDVCAIGLVITCSAIPLNN